MSKRKTERVKKRLSCEIHAGGRRFTGIILDVSGTGVFVQTSARLKPKLPVRLLLKLPQGDMEVDAEVARAKVVPPQLRTSAGGGLGLTIPEPPDHYLRFVEMVQPGASAAVRKTGT